MSAIVDVGYPLSLDSDDEDILVSKTSTTPKRPVVTPPHTAKKMLNFRKPQKFVTISLPSSSSRQPNQDFVIHRDLISYHSPFFKSAFDSNFIEGQTQTMKVEEVEVEVFGLMVHWLYTQKVEFEDGEGKGNRLLLLGKLWMLADRYLMPTLQNASMDKIFLLFLSVPPESTKRFLALAYSVQQESPLKKVVTDLSAWQAPEVLARRIQYFPKDMLKDITMTLSMRCSSLKTGVQRKSVQQACQYYVESDETNH